MPSVLPTEPTLPPSASPPRFRISFPSLLIRSVAISGLLVQKELKYLYGAIDDPKRPLAAIVGGAKVSSKLPVLESLMEKCQTILVGGGMIFTFYKAMGLNIGSSLVEDDLVTKASEIVEKAKAKGVKFVLPTDVVVADKFAADANFKTVCFPLSCR